VNSSFSELLPQVTKEQHDFDLRAADWAAIYRNSGGSVHCRSGCDCCCSLAVNCTFPESLFIASAITPTQASRLQERADCLRALLPQTTGIKEFLKAHRSLPGGCPFLSGDGTCSIYPIRPLSCRSLLSTRESNWCNADFSELTTEEKQAFMASLDRSAVAFPTHYAALPQELASTAEQRLLSAMLLQTGLAIYGNLPLLVHLEYAYGISNHLLNGISAVSDAVAAAGLLHPFLITIIEE